MNRISNLLSCSATVTTAVSLSIFLTANSTRAASLIKNGNFATGDFTGWNDDGSQGVSIGDNGLYADFFGKSGSLGFTSQTISTVAGQKYQLSYNLLSDGATPNQFQVKVNSITLFDKINIAAQPFTAYNFTFTATGSDTIRFGGRNDLGFLQLENVAVNLASSSTAVPEPFTIIGTLVGGTAAFRLRKKLRRSVK